MDHLNSRASRRRFLQSGILAGCAALVPSNVGAQKHQTYAQSDRSDLSQLRLRFRGELKAPLDAGYDAARTPWNLATDQHPRLIAIVSDADDVVAAVGFAQAHSLGVAVQATGHGVATACDDGLLINTSRLKGVEIDPNSRVVRVQAGVVWAEVLKEAQRFGLAPLSANAPGVGVLGYTLGGGASWLLRRYGYAADSVRSADVVTADGYSLRANETSNSDLFWALRGGSGNFGVVTNLEFSLYPVAEVYAGSLLYPIENGRDVLGLYGEWVKSVPDELSSAVALAHVPPSASVPAGLRGRWTVAVRACFVGTAAEGADLLQPFRKLASPAVDTFRVMPYSAIGTIAKDPENPTALLVRTELFNELPPGLTEQLIGAVTGQEFSSLAGISIRHLGGAVSRLPENASAVSHRDATFWVNAIARIDGLEGKFRAAYEVDAIRRILQQYATGGVVFNGLDASSSQRTYAAYSPENYRRLQDAKRKYDPENMFRFNHNIPPAGAHD